MEISSMVARALPAVWGATLISQPALSDNGAAAAYTSLDVAMLVVYVGMALLVSFLCSIAESALLSITPSYLAGIEKSRPRQAALLKRLRQDDVDHSLAAILTLNTIAHTMGAIGAGSKASLIFGSSWFGLFSALMTLAILFFTEIVPKTLGAVYWRKLAAPTAIFVRALIFVLYPLIVVFEKVTKLISRGKPVHAFTRDELVAMMAAGAQSGQINEQETRVIRNLFRFGALKARDIMTPRTVICAFTEDMTVNRALESKANIPFSRLPIYRSGIDDVTGFILKDELLLAKARGEGEAKLETLKREIAAVQGDMTLSELLDLFLDRRLHIALVMGDYGETQGLVTLEDVLETLLGMEIVDEMDRVEDMQALARQQWEKRARALGIRIDDNGGKEVEPAPLPKS